MTHATFHSKLIWRTRMVHLRAAYEELIEHISKFLDTDSTRATVGIRSPGEGLIVPQDVLETVLVTLKTKVAETQLVIDNIDNSKVAEDEQTDSKPESSPPQEVPTKKRTAKGKGN